jgi:hypothetical protein
MPMDFASPLSSKASARGRRRRPAARGEKEGGERGGRGAAHRREVSAEEERRWRRTPSRGAGACRRRSGAGRGARFVAGGGRFGSGGARITGLEERAHLHSQHMRRRWFRQLLLLEWKVP